MQQRTDYADQMRKGRKIYLFDSFIEAQVVRKAMQNIYINSCRPHKPRREYFFFFIEFVKTISFVWRVIAMPKTPKVTTMDVKTITITSETKAELNLFP